MGINKVLKEIMQYLTEAFARIFGPNDDEYPNIGVQPFEGEIRNSDSIATGYAAAIPESPIHRKQSDPDSALRSPH